MPRPVAFSGGLQKELDVKRAVQILEDSKDCLPNKYYLKRKQFDEIIGLLKTQRKDIQILRFCIEALNKGVRFEREIILEVDNDEFEKE
jgi:hypothetical protein